MTSRPYQDGDLSLLVALASELWRNDPGDVECTFGQIAFWSSQLPRTDWTAQLWFAGDGDLKGWGWLSGDELEAQVRPERRELLDEILEWGQPATMAVRPHNEDAIARMRMHGLEHDPDAPWHRENHRALDAIAKPSLPLGYRLATMAEYDDLESRSAAHRSAFAPSRFTDEAYASVRSAAAYRADLDCVVLDPAGAVAAYALAWLDEENAIGELEPVGTRRDQQRRGLARAVNLFALQRLREKGATLALVGSRGDAAHPVPSLLYESIGFREATRSLAFTRTA